MKIGMPIISNKPEKLGGFINTIGELHHLRDLIELSVAIQPPFKGNESFLSEFDHVTMMEPTNKGDATPFLKYRRGAMLPLDHVDWFWQLDDDHRMTVPKGKKLNRDVLSYYSDVIQYIEEHRNVGVISCKGYFGGASCGYDFIDRFNPVANNMISTNHGGIFLRNIGVDNLVSEEETKMVGALEEGFMAFKIFELGYGFAKRYNSPIRTSYPRHEVALKRPSYLQELINDNIQGWLRKKYNQPDWVSYDGKLPRKINMMLLNRSNR